MFLVFIFNSRPKLCLEKCDANISTLKVSTVEQPQVTTTTNTTAEVDSAVFPNNNCIDLNADEDKDAKADQPAAVQQEQQTVQSSDFKVPEQYKFILQNPGFVNLIKYDDTKSQTDNKR